MTAHSMTIGQLARDTSTKATTIRYYETIGLLRSPLRTESGRRSYGKADLQRLQFVRNGRRLGFSIDELRSLIGLAEKPEQDCSAASSIAARHLKEIETRIGQLALLRDELLMITRSCDSAQIANCQIIQGIGDRRVRRT